MAKMSKSAMAVAAAMAQIAAGAKMMISSDAMGRSVYYMIGADDVKVMMPKMVGCMMPLNAMKKVAGGSSRNTQVWAAK